MWGDNQSANSAASTMMPRQSADGLPETGGGDGHDRYGLLPLAAAVTRTLMSYTAAEGTGASRFTVPARDGSPSETPGPEPGRQPGRFRAPPFAAGRTPAPPEADQRS